MEIQYLRLCPDCKTPVFVSKCELQGCLKCYYTNTGGNNIVSDKMLCTLIDKLRKLSVSDLKYMIKKNEDSMDVNLNKMKIIEKKFDENYDRYPQQVLEYITLSKEICSDKYYTIGYKKTIAQVNEDVDNYLNENTQNEVITITLGENKVTNESVNKDIEDFLKLNNIE